MTASGECFITWNTDFSTDCGTAVLEDCKWKKVDSFEQLAGFIGEKATTPEYGVGGGSVLSPHQFSSTVINTSAGEVFELVKTLNFKWMRAVSTVQSDEDGTTLNVAYADDTVQKIHMLERSDLDLKVAWEVLESEPSARTFSTVHTIRCYQVTTSKACYITWNTDFSNDVTSEVIEDSRWKKSESFEQLQDFLCPKQPASSAAA